MTASGWFWGSFGSSLIFPMTHRPLPPPDAPAQTLDAALQLT
jgi:hypothetical protein